VAISNAKHGTDQLPYNVQIRVNGALALTRLSISSSSASSSTEHGPDGGAVKVSSTLLRSAIKNCGFTANQASGNGGAIAIAAGHVDIQSSTLNNNKADGAGGAIYVSGDGSMTLHAVTLQSNSAGLTGGAIHLAAPSQGRFTIVGSHLMAKQCIFTDNRATKHGFAVMVDGANARYGNDGCTETREACGKDDGPVPRPLQLPRASSGY
jgi:predicted outer membrane repeat protein